MTAQLIRRWIPLILSISFCPGLLAADRLVVVRVIDSTGASITHGSAELRCGTTIQTLPLTQGRLEISAPASQACSLRIEADGFSPRLVTLDKKNSSDDLTITLARAPIKQSVTVTASRSHVGPPNLPVTEITKSTEELAVSPSVTIDDKLRQVPGFTLFRRSGSQTTNPTSQGVSLRGLGASGSSRTLVLADGIPLNDPFGGWVYWARVPLQSIDHAELMEGGASDLYGSNALGGVIYLDTREADKTAFYGESSVGTLNSPLGSGLFTTRIGKWGISAAAEAFRTDGYVPVALNQRGTADTEAASRHRTGDLLLQRSLSNDGTVFLHGSLFGESRENGTNLQVNSATIRQLSTGADWKTDLGDFALRAFGGTESLHQTFSAISADRNSETLTTDQHVPVHDYGFSAQWSSKASSKHIFVAGVDGHDITGDTNELQFAAGPTPATYIAGGRQRSLGVFVEGLFQLTPKWMLTTSARGDVLQYVDASSRRRSPAGILTQNVFPDRSNAEVSPRLGLTRVITQSLSLHASAYRSFRAPTLNELYRPFRVGNISTLANQNLRSEHFTGGELGATVQVHDRLLLRAAGFVGFLDDTIGNVTLTTAPSLITRQRQNLDTVRVRGFELSVSAPLAKGLNIQGAYQFIDSEITAYKGIPSLIGLTVPEVARHAVTFSVSYDHPRIATVVLQGRAAGREYEDDQNLLPLDRYLNMGLFISRELRPGLTAFIAVENLLNSRYSIGRTPIQTISAPFESRVGMRFHFAGHKSS